MAGRSIFRKPLLEKSDPHRLTSGSGGFCRADHAIAQNRPAIGPLQKPAGKPVFEHPGPPCVLAAGCGSIFGMYPSGEAREAGHDMLADIDDPDVAESAVLQLAEIVVTIHHIGPGDMRAVEHPAEEAMSEGMRLVMIGQDEVGQRKLAQGCEMLPGQCEKFHPAGKMIDAVQRQNMAGSIRVWSGRPDFGIVDIALHNGVGDGRETGI